MSGSSGPSEVPTIMPGNDLSKWEEKLNRFKSSWIFLAALLLLVAACGSPAATPEDEASIRLAPVSDLSPELRQLTPEFQEAYRYALANRSILEKIPCYCGCNAVGHMDNWMCYVRSEGAEGQVVLDYHAAG